MIYLLYLLNGFLAVLWLLVDHALLALLLLPLVSLGYTAPEEQRPWTLAAAGLSFLAAACAPAPVPVLTFVMAVAGILAARVEQFNVAAVRWNTVRGLALYGLAGLGFQAYQGLLEVSSTGSPLLAQGQLYFSAIAAFGMYLIPLGFLALLAQSLWAHPPVPGKPADLINAIRSRGKGN